MLESPIWRPIVLSTLAGLSTSLGALLSIVYSPDQRMMAVLLGLAIGVMATVSIVELVVKNALEHSALLVLVSSACGALAYYILAPLIPKQDPESDATVLARLTADEAGEKRRLSDDKQPQQSGAGGDTGAGGGVPEAPPWKPTDEDLIRERKASHLLRLGLVMAVTMTLHNLPEGFAVAFSAFTPLGPIMAVAIAMHNIPEGIIIAAPIFAATGSRWRALALATASGLSEPFGAMVAVLLLRPFLDAESLQYVLAGTGGLMLAVCVLELWPEARNCRNDRGLTLGIGFGSLVMASTLYIEEVAREHMHNLPRIELDQPFL